MATPNLGIPSLISPDPQPWSALLDMDGAAFNAAVLPASSAWKYTEVFNVTRARLLLLAVFYNAHAATTTGQARVRLLASNELAEPAVADDSWVEVSIRDDLEGTPAALAGAMGTGVDITATELRNVLTSRGLSNLVPQALANSAKIRHPLVFDVSVYRWCCVSIQETGDTTNRGTVTPKASLTV